MNEFIILFFQIPNEADMSSIRCIGSIAFSAIFLSNYHLGQLIFKRVVQFFHRIQSHEITLVTSTCTIVGRCRYKLFVGIVFLHFVQYTPTQVAATETLAVRLCRKAQEQPWNLPCRLLTIYLFYIPGEPVSSASGYCFFKSTIFSNENWECTWQAPSHNNISRPVILFI